MTALLHFARVLAGRTYAPLVCSVNADHTRAWLSPTEAAVYRTHRRLLCPCGGSLLSAYRSPLDTAQEPL